MHALFTAWTWGQTRDMSQSFRTLQDRLKQLSAQRDTIVQLLLERRGLLEGHRVKRDGGTGRGKSGNGKKSASHFEIHSVQQVGDDGAIKGWTEELLNMSVSKAVRYDPDTGTFKVERSGVYFLYCQVQFNENQSLYVKLVVSVNKVNKLQCMEGYGTTPSSGSHLFHFLKPCQVSGLLRLERGAELKASTVKSYQLHPVGKHYFGLFKVN
ncbi:tumor necrosis factor ligand superfamily member 12 isoform X2 [Conger conger]|uniref:tumor necrosis factor ligand superfamily member 12 isoform X2 n=1 Tax=Conger conger TaxID=82655 RepID=UPI002A5A8E44|nr:tumor necrosis factor ligand superfamily member 12 isoform X2 [Conger conger]